MRELTMKVLDSTGDTKTIFDIDKEDEVKNARRTFKDLTDKSYIAYYVKKDGEKGIRMDEFNPDSGAMIFVKKMVGG